MAPGPTGESYRSLGGGDELSHAQTVAGTLRRVVTERLQVDPRGLASLRIALGLLLLTDLALRSRDLVVFYTDQGVLPRAVLRESFGGLAAFAFAHGTSGQPAMQGLLFVMAGIAAGALLLGYRTRLATLVSFLLLASLHARNPVLLNAGDSLLRRLLFWGLFLPLGGRWSIDAYRGAGREAPVRSVATAALLIQVVIVYAVNAVIKLRGEAWVSGEAIRIVFGLDHLTVRFGDLLTELPVLLEGLGWLWLGLLVASPLLLALRGRSRAAFAGLFALMHLGMALTMRLGLFPLISITALLPFVPPSVWRSWTVRFGSSFQQRVQPVTRGRWLERRLPRFPRFPLDPRTRRRLHRTGQVVVAVLLVLILLWNAAGLGFASVPDDVGVVADPSDRRWDMFAPAPRRNDGWFVAPAKLESGRTVDAFAGGQLSWDRPPELARAYPSHRWFVYLIELPRRGSAGLRRAFADYLCRRWNDEHDSTLRSVRLVYVLEPVRLDRPERRQRVGLGRYSCPGG